MLFGKVVISIALASIGVVASPIMLEEDQTILVVAKETLQDSYHTAGDVHATCKSGGDYCNSVVPSQRCCPGSFCAQVVWGGVCVNDPVAEHLFYAEAAAHASMFPPTPPPPPPAPPRAAYFWPPTVIPPPPPPPRAA